MSNVQCEIDSVIQEVETASFEKRTHPPLSENDKNNELLDAILSFKSNINNTSDKLNYFTMKFEEITWFKEINDDSLKLINKLISSAFGLHHVLVKQYADYYPTLRKKGIAKDDIKNHKQALDDFKESILDLELVFFKYPKDIEFTSITDELIRL